MQEVCTSLATKKHQ